MKPCRGALARAELSELEESVLFKRGKEIYEALHPETKQGEAQARGMNKALGHNVSDKMAPTFASDTAQKTGQSERTIQRKTRIGEALEPAVDWKRYQSKRSPALWPGS